MTKLTTIIKVNIFLAQFVIASGALAGETLRIATAANFILPMEKIVALFSEQTGIEVQTSYGSSGKLFAQINQGAPYDLFLSADLERPQELYKKGLSRAPFEYATGQVVLWSTQTNLQAITWQQALAENKGRIAIANPQTAPYGKVVATVLGELGLLKVFAKRLVYGQSVAQVFQFVETKNTVFGFVALPYALSAKGRQGKSWPLPEVELVIQGGCQLTTGRPGQAVQLFIAFLTSDAVHLVKKEFGYL